jgi:hypothetical protein
MNEERLECRHAFALARVHTPSSLVREREREREGEGDKEKESGRERKR